MNRDEVIELAKKAGWSGLYITWAEPDGKPDWSPCKETLTVPVTIEQVERFADLVEERCIEAVRDGSSDGDYYANRIRGKAY